MSRAGWAGEKLSSKTIRMRRLKMAFMIRAIFQHLSRKGVTLNVFE